MYFADACMLTYRYILVSIGITLSHTMYKIAIAYMLRPECTMYMYQCHMYMYAHTHTHTHTHSKPLTQPVGSRLSTNTLVHVRIVLDNSVYLHRL